ncbi:hypothetical protein HGP13_34155 [Mesorhizobium sp. NZP2077]|uniref:CoA transferase n=1 Tax=Mesorhizobium sp. NZP2077 TaxID=2483404 RepID=UPI0015562649|nr:CoA transferase [Mesorhizobium sp. NZP2077]QKD19587.1 hypothetical protein HGP13_34155 [Mesorhizobium sp. NZP2077]
MIGFAEATWTQMLSGWIGSHVRMFVFSRHSRITILDNLKSGKSSWSVGGRKLYRDDLSAPVAGDALSRVWPRPYASYRLADAGARVIKVEKPEETLPERACLDLR